MSNNIPQTFNYCVSVDGSKHSDFAIEVVLSEFFKQGDKIEVIHIKNNDFGKLTLYDYEVHKVLDHYINKNGKSIAKKDYKSSCIDRNTDSKHSLQQAFQRALEKRANILFIGFKGTKASPITIDKFPKNGICEKSIQNDVLSMNKSLTKGILYILQLPRIPFPITIVKEVSSRKNKDNKGFTWCFCIKDLNSSFQLFKRLFSLGLINKENDFVRGIHIKPLDNKYDKTLSKKFKQHCKEIGVKQHHFKYIDHDEKYPERIGLQISNLVNFGDEYVDFTICHYDSNSYYYVENHPLYDIIMNVESNIVFGQGIINLLLNFLRGFQK